MHPLTEPLIGRTLGQRYRLERLLGAGGMGAVFEATQLDIGRLVAVKVLLDVDPRSIARLRQEALSAGSLSSPHVVSIFDFQTPEGEPPFIVMELLPGHSLAKLLVQKPVLSAARAARIACQMLIGLEAAHRAGVIHRDVKPSNTWLVFAPGIDEHVKMLDFGIAKMLDGTGSIHTTTGSVVGTPGYLSPEQLRGAPLDARVDIHAMGVVLFEMLTGARPWRPDTASVFVEILEREPPPVHTVVPNVPPGLSAVIARALAKNPAHRFQHASEMRVALEPFAAHTASTPTVMGALGDGQGPTVDITPRAFPAPPTVTMTTTGPAHAVPPTFPAAHGATAPFAVSPRAANDRPAPVAPARARSSLLLPVVIGGGFVLLSASGIGAALLLRPDPGPVGLDARGDGGAPDGATALLPPPPTSSTPGGPDAGTRITSANATGPRGAKVAPVTVDASAPVAATERCLCIEDRTHLRVCLTPLAPSCECRGPSDMCPKVWLNGTCPTPKDPGKGTFGGAGRKTGEACSGFLDFSDNKPHPATGTLQCSVCYGRVPVDAVAGAPCKGVNDSGTTEAGHFVCGQ